MRYDTKAGCIEISIGELCPEWSQLRGLIGCGGDYDRGGDIVDMYLPELRAGGAPRDIELTEEFGGVVFRVSGRADAVTAGDLLRVSEVEIDGCACVNPHCGGGGSEDGYDGGEGSGNEAGEADCGGGKKRFGAPGDAVLCLAYMFCRQYGSDRAEIEIVRHSLKRGVTDRYIRVRSVSALRAVFEKNILKKLPLARMMCERGKIVLPGAATVKFPYTSLRDGQERMMRECYDAMLAGERLFVQAPTGIGKTISALYPAVKFLGNGRCDKIFYLTAKSSTQTEAYRAAGRLFDCGARLRTIVISSKESCCLMRGIRPRDLPCGSFRCVNSRASENRVREAVLHLLGLQNGYEQRVIGRVAREFSVCPYELSLELSEYCDIIIADYNYAFDPLVRLERYFADPDNTSRYIFLVDEAHNLADRTRSMYSAEISLGDLAHLASLAKSANNAGLCAALDCAAETLGGLRRLCRDNMTRGEDGVLRGYATDTALPHGINESFSTLIGECERGMFTPKGGGDTLAAAAASLYRRLVRFITVAASFESRFLFYCEAEGEAVRAMIYCLDPSEILCGLLERADSAVMFSATLTPLDYFSDILGGGVKSRTLALPSPYRRENLFIAAAGNVSTRYEDRDKTLAQTVSYIAAAVSGKRGNYIAYFPSYKYMMKAVRLFEKKFPRVRLAVQRPDMTRAEREEFLLEFRADDDAMRVGFCVLGGVFSEGIDLPGSRLIGVVIVGVGIPGLSSERNIIRDYYEISRGAGYDYVYTYPGMNSVLQAAGRVIRGEDDRGVVLLIDDRYATGKYAAMYPEHWSGMQYYDSPASLSAAVSGFWGCKD